MVGKVDVELSPDFFVSSFCASVRHSVPVSTLTGSLTF